MDNREKLIELLNEAEEYEANTCMFHSGCEDCPGNKYRDKCRDYLKADHLIANGVTIQKWIPVTERFPEYSVAVNLHTKSGVVGTGFYNKHIKRWVQWYSGGSCSVDVTHWMPLPEQPKGE